MSKLAIVATTLLAVVGGAGTRSMTTIRRATCRANGIRQFYLEAGAGPPVVLLHGFPETSFAWRFQIPALAPHYRVIAPDLRGYGETDKPSKGYDKRTMANDIVELLETLGVGRVALVGHDRGAWVATVWSRIIPNWSTAWSSWTTFRPALSREREGTSS